MKLLITALALAVSLRPPSPPRQPPVIAATWVSRDKAMTARIRATP